jgi:hypothetical protein
VKLQHSAGQATVLIARLGHTAIFRGSGSCRREQVIGAGGQATKRWWMLRHAHYSESTDGSAERAASSFSTSAWVIITAVPSCLAVLKPRS